MGDREQIAVVGLGYVGLPLAVALSNKYENTIAFDINERRIASLKGGIDTNSELTASDLEAGSIIYTADPSVLAEATFIIVAVPTPVDKHRKPDIGPLVSASNLVGKGLKRGAVVVYESTVYPGVTEDICGPILAKQSGLVQGKDFFLGYSPERMNPGDKEHTVERIVKVVAGDSPATLDRVAKVYESVILAGIHRAPTIQVAESAKVIENIQRDVNIALINELAMLFDRLNINTQDVLAAAGTKWNFLPFRPGLVGGHCIGVDPYYLTYKAAEVGFHPEMISAGRRINDTMGEFIANKAVMLLGRQQKRSGQAVIGVLGATFKEDVNDFRNSRVPEMIESLQRFGFQVELVDPLIGTEDFEEEYGVKVAKDLSKPQYDCLILAVSHKVLLDDWKRYAGKLCEGGVLIDVKSALKRDQIPAGAVYWSL